MSLASLRGAGVSCFVFAFAAACGGSVFNQKDDNGSGGSTNTGGSSSQSGSASTGGKPSKGGSSATGGSVGKAGSSSSAGTTSVGGGPNCDAVDCAFPECADGQMPVTPAGRCCPICPPPQLGCNNVICEPVMACGAGYKLTQPAGACCQGCIPEAGQVACPKIACPRSTCQLGYVRGDLVGGCCTECVPDALFCNDDSECVVADRPRSCCGCPEIISTRAYDADPCWSAIAEPRPIPKSCYPQAICDEVCGPCPAPPSASCQNHRCLDIGLK